jgi:hypothetical protein
MSGPKSLPLGLRHVLIYACLGQSFPLPKDTSPHVALMQAANTARQRKAKGAIDAVIFVLSGTDDTRRQAAAIQDYGFPECIVVSSSRELGDCESDSDVEEWAEDTARLITQVLARQHPGAIAFFEGEYDATEFWWSGVEHEVASFDWPFSDDGFASQLPDAHSARAATWLGVIEHAMELAGIQETSREGVAQQRAAVIAATLSEWLHGYGAASGNSSNHFENDSPIRALAISDVFLGYEAARISGIDLDRFCDEEDADMDELRGAALASITRQLRMELRSALSRFFGGDGALFWALHSAIWPRFDQPMLEAFSALLNLHSTHDIGELEAPWSFVVDGWCDEATA